MNALVMGQNMIMKGTFYLIRQIHLRIYKEDRLYKIDKQIGLC